MPDLITTNNPHDVPAFLHAIATRYREDQAQLQDAWQDPKAGLIWGELAKVLERATDQARAVIDKHWEAS